MKAVKTERKRIFGRPRFNLSMFSHRAAHADATGKWGIVASMSGGFSAIPAANGSPAALNSRKRVQQAGESAR
jgi:hypothetical protein